MAHPNNLESSSEARNGDEKAEAPPSYEAVLREIGEFGLYQVLASLIVGFIFAYGSFVTLNFIFGADIVDHRCWIPQCEPSNSNDFHADWLPHAIPLTDGRPEPCSRYEFIGSAGDACSEPNFNRSRIVACDGFIIKNNEQRLLSHLNMMCTGQDSKLALLGTASTLGRTIAMLIAGFVSDKYGRLITITVSTTLGAVLSVLQALPSHLMSFELYLALEFLASLLSTGLIAAGFVYVMEWTTAKYRVRIVNIMIFIEVVIPYTCLSLAAWYFADNFVAYRLVLSVPGLLALAVHFILGESPQWLLSQNKSDRAVQSFSKAAKLNGKSLHAHTIQRIEQLRAQSTNRLADDRDVVQLSIVDLLRQKTLAFRLFITSVVWMCLYFAYYGVFFGSAKVHENKYLSVTLIGLADIPGNLLNDQLLNRIGRRLTIGLTLPIFSAMLIASTQLPASQETVQLILFVIGKAAIMAACIGYHTFSTEFWPTAIRGTAANVGTTAARLGSIFASLAVLLDNYHKHLPVFLNAAAGILGTVLILAFLPETMHCDKLPDTMEEALDIGRSARKKSANSMTAD